MFNFDELTKRDRELLTKGALVGFYRAIEWSVEGLAELVRRYPGWVAFGLIVGGGLILLSSDRR